MERRLAITYIVSATTTFGFGCVAIAAAGGGLFASAAPKSMGGKQLEIVDQYIVLRSSTSVPTSQAAAPTLDAVVAPAAASGVAAPTGLATAQPDVAAPDVEPNPTTNAPSPTPETAPAPQATPETAPTPEPAPSTSSAPAPAPTTPTTMAPKPPTTTAPPAAVASGARIPRDWPANKPIPPIPPGCEKPQLEDNGKWNCE